VVDNASEPDAIAALCEQRPGGAEAILSPDNRGFAAGVNLALDHLAAAGHSGPVLLLNPDAEVEPEALAALRAELDRGADAAGPLLVYEDGRLQVGAAGGRLTAFSVVAYFLFLAHLVPAVRGIFLTRRQLRRAGPVDWLCAACLLLSHHAWHDLPRWPEDEIVYAEDIAWGTAATAAGARLVLVPSVRVVHRQGASGGASAWSGALIRLCRRRLGPVRSRPAVVAIRVGIAVRRLAGRRIA
jgi:N-acetylglucosaminyl-diphospho-decaprenol L-rhamnosyltransferase